MLPDWSTVIRKQPIREGTVPDGQENKMVGKMLQKEEIDSRIGLVLDHSEHEHSFHSNGLLTVNRMIAFVFFEQESKEKKPGRYCSSCIAEMDKLKDSLIRNDSVCFFYVPCDAPDGTLFQQFCACFQKAGEDHVVDNLHEVWICPVVLGRCLHGEKPEEVSKVAQKIAGEWVFLQQSVRQKLGILLHWQPFVLLELSHENSMNRRTCLELVQWCVERLREEMLSQNALACNRICLITELDEDGQRLSLESRMRAVLLNVVVQVFLRQKVRGIFPTSGHDRMFYSASAVSLTAPVRYLSLMKMETVLKSGLCTGRTGKELIDLFGNELTKLPEKVFWRDQLYRLPREGDSITTEPVWSVILGNDADDEKRLRRFAKQYYLSLLDVKVTRKNIGIFEEWFLQLYFMTGGSLEDLKYFSTLESDDALKMLISKVQEYKLRQIKVSGREYSQNAAYFNAEQKLAQELRDKPARVLMKFLDKNSDFITQLREKVKQLLGCKNQILQELDACKARWCYDEIVFSNRNLQDSGESINNLRGYLRELQEHLIQVMQAKEEKREEMMLAILDWCYIRFHGEIMNRTEYMQHLTTFIQNATEAEYDSFFHRLNSKLKLPVHLNAIDRGQDQFFMMGSEGYVLQRIQKSFRIPNPIILGANEQLELLRLSQPFELGNMLGIG